MDNAQVNFPQAENPILEQIVGVSAQIALDPQNQHRLQMMEELLAYCNNFITASAGWRRTSFEPQWHTYQRNADSIYDPNLTAKKESWQSRAFVPTTATHRENITAALFKMMVGVTPPVEVRARYSLENDQSANIRDLIVREMEKSRFPVDFNSVLEDATTYGSGFCRIRWEQIVEERRVRSPQQQQINIMDPNSILQAFKGQRPTVGYQTEVKPVIAYRGVKFEWLPIWDIFPDPKALKIKGNSIAYRYKQLFGEIVEGVKNGYYFPEVIDRLLNTPSREIEPSEKAIVDADRGIAPSNLQRTQYSRKLENYEFYGRIPKKWVLINGEPIDDPDVLVPARVLFNQACVICVEPNLDYEGEPPIYKLDYLPVSGRFYGRGICEMLVAPQEIINETVNQRIDNVALVLNRMYGVIDKAVVDPNDFVSKPGGMFRLNAKYVQDIRQAIMPFETPDVTVSAYKDVLEMERYAQERTSSRTNLGTSGITGDAANRTATGLEIVRQSAGEKFAYIGMLAEFTFMYDIFRAFWKTIYANIVPQDILNALGQERAMTFQLITPEEIESSYQYEAQGIFTMENRTLTQQRLAGLFAQFQMEPWVNPMAFFDKEAKANNLDPEALKYSPEEMQQVMMAKATMEGQFDPPGTSAPGAPPMPKPMGGQNNMQPPTAPIPPRPSPQSVRK